MRANVYSEKGIKTPTTVELPKEIFGIKPNEVALRQYLHVYRINQRQGTASTKTRGEVRGGGRKPWPQKGTGRSRQGSIRSPLWVGGGIAHGPQPKDFEATMPKKMRDLALRSALSFKAAASKVHVLSDFKPKLPKTSAAVALLKRLGVKKPLLVAPEVNLLVVRSFRNIPGVRVREAGALNAYEVVEADDVLVLKDGLGKLKERLVSKPEKPRAVSRTRLAKRPKPKARSDAKSDSAPRGRRRRIKK